MGFECLRLSESNPIYQIGQIYDRNKKLDEYTRGRPPRGPVRGGPPAEGPRGGGAARRGAPWGGAARRGARGSPKRLYKAPTGYTKPRKTIQGPNRLYKDPTDYRKPPKDYRKTQNIKQNLTILNQYLKYLTRVA